VDALLISFILAALGEWGDKTQLLALAFGLRFGRPGPVLAGVAVGALLNALLAAAGGMLVHGYITLRATSLLVAVAMIYAGVAGLIAPKKPDLAENWKTGPFVTTAVCFFLLEFGDKTQFITFGVSAQYGAMLLAAAGATLGVLASSAPAVLIGPQLDRMVPAKAIRIGAAILFLLAGFYVAVSALRLI
jgi:putative Ca2+/H+ antiporter (TMEM165/GDT1 family)